MSATTHCPLPAVAPLHHQQSNRLSTSKLSIDRQLFIRNVIEHAERSNRSALVLPKASHQLLPPREKEKIVLRRVNEMADNIKRMEDFITMTEDILRRERERDYTFYMRERKRRAKASSVHKVNRSPSIGRNKQPTFRITSARFNRKILSYSPRDGRARMAFSGRGSVNTEDDFSVDDDDESDTNFETAQDMMQYITNGVNEDSRLGANSTAADYTDMFSGTSTPSFTLTDRHPVHNGAFFNFDCSITSDDKYVIDDLPMTHNLYEEHGIEMKDLTMYSDIENDGISRAMNESTIEQYTAADAEMFDVDEGALQRVESSIRMDSDCQDRMPGKSPSFISSASNLSVSSEIAQQIRYLVRRFTLRTNQMQSRLAEPPTPSDSGGSQFSRQPPKRVVDFEQSPTRINSGGVFKADVQHHGSSNPFVCPSLCGRGGSKAGVLDPQGYCYISWLCIVSMTFLYNAWVIPLRSTFPFQTPENTNDWLIADFCADVIYLFDVIFIKHRIMYLYEGFWVRDKDLTRKNYINKLQFKLDILSLVPLDLLYLVLGTNAVYLRAPRLLKIQSFWELFRLLDRVIASPYLVRVGRTLTYMLYMIHITACTYYAYSDYQGLGSDRWVFSGKGHPYVRCFAFATKTATSIGKNPKPDSEGELMFMTAAWLMGVFVFALLIGQIRDIIATATRSQTEYRQLVDETLECMRTLNLPADSQDRVKKWFKFTWEQQRTLDEALILDYLPSNLKTDIAIAVHIQTLSKVQLFADCEEALLRELVLKLRSVTYLPDDFVCRKGEIGREMYIVKWGQVQVMGGPKNDEVLATLAESSVFGEISLLAINGIDGKRRTADVRSKGFSNLFVLSKSDLNDAIVQYPMAQAILKRRAQSVMRRNAAREREQAIKSTLMDSVDIVIANPVTPPTPPKLLDTVICALPKESAAVQLLTHGSKKQRKSLRGNKIKPIEVDVHRDELKICNDISHVSPPSPDLLASIQMALDKRNHFLNMTDSEKASIIDGQPEKIFRVFKHETDINCDMKLPAFDVNNDDDVDAFSQNA